MRLANLNPEYAIVKEIKNCHCKGGGCSGKFLKIKHWQYVCQWEALRLFQATRMDLNINIFKNMKLTLTIQELEDKDTKELYKGIFGTLILQRHKDELEENMLEWAEKDKIYNDAVEKNEENNLIQPKKPELKGINFALNLKSVEGLEDIINQLITDATNLERNEKFEKMRKSVKEKNEKAEQGVEYDIQK